MPIAIPAKFDMCNTRKHFVWNDCCKFQEYSKFLSIIAMDHNNLRNMARFVGGDPEHKVSLLMDHTRRPGDVADPWYTGDFEATWQDVLEGCTALLEELR